LENVICIVSIVVDAYEDVYTLVVKGCDVIDKHMDCEMNRRGSCTSGGRGREKKCATSVIATTPSKTRRPLKGLLVFVNTIWQSTSNTPLRRFTRLKKDVFQFLIYVVEVYFEYFKYATLFFLHLILFDLVFTQLFGPFIFEQVDIIFYKSRLLSRFNVDAFCIDYGSVCLSKNILK
jgi:hypothetical protein